MRKLIVALVAVLCLAAVAPKAYAGQYVAPGQYTGSPSPQVTAIFAAFPNGGQGLTDAIRELLINDPGLADDVAFVASNSNPSQQLAAANGMAQAAVVLASRGNTTAMAAIVTAAQSSGNAVLASVVTTAQIAVGGSANLYGSQTNSNPNATTISCTTTSPTGPGGSC